MPTSCPAAPLSDTDRAMIDAWLSGAESFTPDPSTRPYDRAELGAAVREILDEHLPAVPAPVAVPVAAPDGLPLDILPSVRERAREALQESAALHERETPEWQRVMALAFCRGYLGAALERQDDVRAAEVARGLLDGLDAAFPAGGAS